MSDDLQQRIEAMFSIDKLWAWGFVIALWLTYIFIFYAVLPLAGIYDLNGYVKVALILGGALVLIYNTASITAMIRHYREDKEHIYSLDIRHIDEMKARKGKSE